MADDRFSPFFKDPRSRKIPKHVQKTKIDKRFQSMFKKEQFKSSGIDSRGRKLNLTTSENLKNLYNVTDSSEDEDQSLPETSVVKITDKKKKTTETNVKKDESCYQIKVSDCSNKRGNTLTEKRKSIKVPSANLSDEKSDSDEKSISETNQDLENKEEKCTIYSKKSKNILLQNDEDNLQKISKYYTKNLKPTEIAKDVTSDESSDEDDTDSDASEEESMSSSEDDSDTSEEEIDKFDHHWEELHDDAPTAEEITKRLAVCNMDWDRIRADDLFAVFNSFKPSDSIVHSVKIYPSEFGLKRMEEEKLKGPQELTERTLDPEEEELEDVQGSKYHREKLRQYQINRLKYYYAVVECDTPETANTLYEQLNGMEYESSSVRFDLRYIPDDLTFDEEPTSVADRVPDATEYKPRVFMTSALQQVKVNLTWDETDPQRRDTLQKAFTEPESIENDIKGYLASSSEDSDDEVELDKTGMKASVKERISKFKALLQSLEEKEKENEDKVDMEITWDPDLKEATEKIVKQKMVDVGTPFEEMLKKKKENRKMKKHVKKSEVNPAEQNDLDSEDSDFDPMSGEKLANIEEKKKVDELYLMTDSKKEKVEAKEKLSKKKKIKQKKEQKTSNFEWNVMDPRFSALYTSHDFNIDPSDPHFKETDGTKAIIQEKHKRMHNREGASQKNKRAKYQ